MVSVCLLAVPAQPKFWIAPVVWATLSGCPYSSKLWKLVGPVALPAAVVSMVATTEPNRSMIWAELVVPAGVVLIVVFRPSPIAFA